MATHNGAERLKMVLAAYAQAEDPGSVWQLCVVDNGSTDDTPVVLKSFCHSLPLVILHQPRPGKNVSLNLAIEHFANAGHDMILTDDDAIPAPTFLREWARTLARQSGHMLFGGSVSPWFRARPDPWLEALSDQFDVLYARTSHAEGPIAANAIYGPNMAVRAAVFAAGLRFDEAMGPNSSVDNYPMGSETEFCVRAAAQLGISAWFSKGPSVAHIVRLSQMTRDFVAARAQRHGRGVAVMRGYPRLTVKSLAQLAILRAKEMRGRPADWWHYNWQIGYRDAVRSRPVR